MQRKDAHAQPPGALELAELRAGDRLDTIIKLAGLVGARRTYRMVLVWFSEHKDPTGRPTVFNAAKIGQFWLALGKRASKRPPGSGASWAC